MHKRMPTLAESLTISLEQGRIRVSCEIVAPMLWKHEVLHTLPNV